MTRLRVGVVGSGIGASHIEGYAALPERYEVVALCDLDPVRGPEVAERFGIPAVTAGYDELLRRDDLDVVDVCTPSGMHQAQAIAALQAGFHVVVEKPVAKSLSEMDAIEAAEAASGKRVCPIFQYRFGHGIQKLHHLIGKGLAGRPSVATAETHWWRGDAYYQAASWRGTFAGELGGCLTTHAIHVHDILCEVLGPLASVHARTSNRLKGNETEDAAVLSLGFASGAFATASVTLSSRQETSRLRFVFEDMVAESGLEPYNPGHDPWTFPSDDPTARARIEAALADFEPLPERFPGQFYRMHAALAGGGPLPVTLADARRSIELLTAAYWSATTGETVALPLPSDHPFYAGWIAAMEREAVHG
ncbi:MAG: Gfo/Idh/MocA family oxidoreductase [Amaricoccus sp.]